MAFDARDFIQHLTESPGVYQMLDASEHILYVGKAKNLKKRVASYFRSQVDHPKTAALVKKIAAIRIIKTPTENAALLLENNLIKQYRPRYNILFKDDKSFPYLHLTAHPYPRLVFYRGAHKPAGDYFGPYASSHAVREALNLLQKLFLIRPCADSFFAHRSRPCLQYHIKRCSAPCVGAITLDDYQRDSTHARAFLQGHTQDIIQALVVRMNQAAMIKAYEQAAFYRDQIQCLHQLDKDQHQHQHHGHCDVFALYEHNGLVAIQVLHVRLSQVIGNHSYFPNNVQEQELAEVLSSFIAQFYCSAAGREIPTTILVSHALKDRAWLSSALAEQGRHKVRLLLRPTGQQTAWLTLALDNAVTALNSHLASRHLMQQRYQGLSDVLGLLPRQEWRLECFDISHTLGEATVAACVVFDQHGPCKNAYRLFHIKNITPGDDYAAMEQALQRRYGGSLANNTPLPDILIIDGGRGQLNKARSVLASLALDRVLLMGIAKGEGRKPGLETLWIGDDQTAVQLPPHASALHLLQHIRDEAHRFAITKHRAKRQKNRHSSLELIQGIGVQKRQQLLNAFGGLVELKKASVAELQKIPGIGPALAQKIYNQLRDFI